MNRISYRLSLLRCDDLLRQAADRRRANEAALAAKASANMPWRRGPLKLRALRLHRSSSHS